ncbi:A disintegrin and metalloproteinase with thrombospondin motifs 12-like [Ixodes scapularis]|uniref:A disintegrin and metalloproteinase with thrombospondin motifs 12-like n=1 Tax=Ixodes scapularis TaxID=6945 RepID=UPI001C39250C|nr:A disintegrin and metalloproteinase with thrombospondin motifs 12-like [Ixodes scapularis]
MNGEKLLHINEKLTLRLEKISVLAKNFVVSSLHGTNQVDKVVVGREVEKNIYRDQSQMAAVSVTEKDGNVEVSGSLGTTLRIVPLPLMGRSADGQIAHRVFEIEEPAEFKTDYIVPTERYNWRRPPIRPQVRIPNVFEVEVFFIFTEDHHKQFLNEQQLLQYAALSVEMVNLRYHDTSIPRIRFVLVGIMMLEKWNSIMQTIEAADDLRPQTHRKRYMLSGNTLTNLADAVQTGHVKVVADLVVLITSLDLADIESGKLSNEVVGLAYLGGLCTIHMRVAQSEDTPHTHSMVPILVHELGHSLGMVHDGDKPKYSTPGNERQVCSASDGFIMAPVAHGPRNGQWSRCSLDQVRGFVRTLKQACFDLLSSRHYSINMTVLPGEGMTKLQLCERTYPGFTGIRVHPDFENSRDCVIWCCFRDYKKCLQAALTDGMQCIYGYHCVKHRCIRKSKHYPSSGQRRR